MTSLRAWPVRPATPHRTAVSAIAATSRRIFVSGMAIWSARGAEPDTQTAPALLANLANWRHAAPAKRAVRAAAASWIRTRKTAAVARQSARRRLTAPACVWTAFVTLRVPRALRRAVACASISKATSTIAGCAARIAQTRQAAAASVAGACAGSVARGGSRRAAINVVIRRPIRKVVARAGPSALRGSCVPRASARPAARARSAIVPARA